jgi:hypothetical protein
MTIQMVHRLRVSHSQALSAHPSNPAPGLRVAQVRLVFTLPEHLRIANESSQLAYIEWFTMFRAPDTDLNIYSVSRSTVDRKPRAEIVPLESIVSSCHLIPKFGTKIPSSWTAENVLQVCRSFFLNRWIDLRMFYGHQLLKGRRQAG